MASRNRIIYASQSVIANGDFLYRVQTLGSTTTFNSTDLFELGQQDIIDVVDDVPTVAVTLDTNDWGSPRTAAAMANVDVGDWNATADTNNGTLVSVSGSTNINFYHGVSLSHFGTTGSEFDLWAPVQSEDSLGTANDNVDQTLFMARCFATGITLNYSTGGEATENYTAETDNKTWFLNEGRFVSQEEWDITGATTTFDLGLADGTNTVAMKSDNTLAFLYNDPASARPSIWHKDDSAGTTNFYPVVSGSETATEAGFDGATNTITAPTGVTIENGDEVRIRYAADAYANGTDGDSDRQLSNYFSAATDSLGVHSDLGGVRQGQVEIYLVDPDASTDYELSLRLQSVAISATLNREQLSELGHLKPYDRPVTFPIEISTDVETTAGDLETFAKFAGKGSEFDNSTLLDLTIDHLLSKDNLILVVQVFHQTDTEAGGTGADRKVLQEEMVGKPYWNAGTRSTYSAIDVNNPEREFPLKTVVVPNLKATNEGYNLSVGQNATQNFSFRSVNKMFMVKGFVPFSDLLLTPGLEKTDN